MPLSRRSLISAVSVGSLTNLFVAGAAAATLASKWMEYSESSLPVQKTDLVLADMHVHLNPRCSYLQEALSSGLLGLAKRSDLPSLEYEHLQSLDGFRELEKGILGTIYGGYVLRCNEIITWEKFHIVALGIQGPYIRNGLTALETIGLVKEAGALAVLAHPYIIPFQLTFNIRTHEELVDIVASKSDAIEIFNGRLPYATGLGDANRKASVLADAHGKPGISVSDDHRCNPNFAGIYLRKDALESSGAIKGAISSGDFFRLEQYNSFGRTVQEGQETLASRLSFFLRSIGR